MSLLCKCSVVLACLSFAVQAASQDQQYRDPIGERAHYVLDKSSARTSKLVKSGWADAQVKGYVPPLSKSEGELGGYEVEFSFDVDVTIGGRKTGSQVLWVPAEYFQASFMENLRRTKSYKGENFNIRYLGIADTRTRDGHSYPQCDRIEFYDIRTDLSSGLYSFFAQILGGEGESVEDANLKALVKDYVPVVGFVKVDISGKARGLFLKMGFDYQAE